MVKPMNHHYSFESPGCIYDEEALTALELAARTAKKVNECVEEVNEIPTRVEQSVYAHMVSGDFKQAIDKFADDVVAETHDRLDNLIGNVEEGPITSMDAEVIDARLSADGDTCTNAGTNIRNTQNVIYEKTKSTVLESVGFYSDLQNVSWDGSASVIRLSTTQRTAVPYPVKITCPDHVSFAVHEWAVENGTGVVTHVKDNGWCKSFNIPTATLFTICMKRDDNGKIYKSDALLLNVEEPAFKQPWYPTPMARVIKGAVNASWNAEPQMYMPGYKTRMVTPIPFKLERPILLSLPTDSDFQFSVHYWTKYDNAVLDMYANVKGRDQRRGTFQRDNGWCKSFLLPAGQWMTIYFNTGDIAIFDELIATEIASVVNLEASDTFVRSIAHRGYSAEAPENTLPAYRMAYNKGFRYVECDVQFTSDNVPVLLHDGTIDRTSNGTGNLSELTYETVSALDFGGWFGEEFTGTKIPTLDEFLSLCKQLSLHPYIEIKTGATVEQVTAVCEAVWKWNLHGKVTYISFDTAVLDALIAWHNTHKIHARIGWVITTMSDGATITTINTYAGVQNEYITFFVDTAGYNSANILRKWKDGSLAYVEFETFTINDEETILELGEGLRSVISGVTSDSIHAGALLAQKALGV